MATLNGYSSIKKKDHSKPIPKSETGGPNYTPSPSDQRLMGKYGLLDRLRFQDITTYEDDITPLRIWVIMNNEWEMYQNICKKIKTQCSKMNHLSYFSLQFY